MPELNIPRENIVFISGIGCNSRLPYYMNTYGFHSIHGRAPAIATGLKASRPDLNVWVITGDGDGLSIGGNHFIHTIRRNIDLKIVLFNNRSYGLTKGQYSPTSRLGTHSPSTPAGSVDAPISALSFALGCNAGFVARCTDTNQKMLPGLLAAAKRHKGTSFVEILQNCLVYNDGVFAGFTEKNVAADRQVVCEHGKKLIFGGDGNKGLRLKTGKIELEVVTIGENGVGEDDILVHDETSRPLASILAAMQPPDLPVAMGILLRVETPAYEASVYAQIEEVTKANPPTSLNDVLRKGPIWTAGV